MLVTAYSIFLVNFAFGLSVRAGLIDSARFRFVHHAIYLLVIVSLAATVIVTAVQGGRFWAPAGMISLLLVMPKFRGRGRGHALWASFCLALYTVVVML